MVDGFKRNAIPKKTKPLCGFFRRSEITTEQVPIHYSRHIMDQCVGCGISEPETGWLEIKEKDLLILTTDGLHKSISDEEMISLFNAETDIETKARSLVQAALDSGGIDNITLSIAH